MAKELFGCSILLAVFVALPVYISTENELDFEIPAKVPSSRLIPTDKKPSGLDSNEDADCKTVFNRVEAIECQQVDGTFTSILPQKFYMAQCQQKSRKSVEKHEKVKRLDKRNVRLYCLPKTTRQVRALSWDQKGDWKNVTCMLPFECQQRYIVEPEFVTRQNSLLRELLQGSNMKRPMISPVPRKPVMAQNQHILPSAQRDERIIHAGMLQSRMGSLPDGNLFFREGFIRDWMTERPSRHFIDDSGEDEDVVDDE